MHPTFARALESPVQANVLVAFCDCSRYRQASKGVCSADLFVHLNDFYLLIDDAIEAAGGLVISFMGDAALVVFPEELADRGIMALLDLKATVDRWIQDRPLGEDLHVDVHFGEVTLGRMGRAGILNVMGEAVAIAATLGSRGFGLSQQAFHKLTPEHRQAFHKLTPPVIYQPNP
jgi:class 3 adenylate cyclase